MLCVVGLASLCFCARGGFYYFTLVDWYFAALTPPIVGVLEVLS